MKIKILIPTLCLAMLISCNFSAGVKKNLSTGLTYSYNGFRLGDVTLYNSYNESLKSNKLPETSILAVCFNHIEVQKTEDGKAHLGCELTVTDTEGTVVLHQADLYETSDGIPLAELKQQVVQVTIGKPMVAGNTYTVKCRMFDKRNEKNVINTSVDIEVTPSEVNIPHTENVLSFENVWFAQESGELPQPKARIGAKVALVFNGVKGFTQENGKVFPGCSVVVTDKDGNQVLGSEDTIEDVTRDGLPPENANRIMAFVTCGDPIKAGETYHVNVRIFDKKNKDAEIKASMDMQVVK